MKIELACFPCFLRQAVIALEASGADEDCQERILREIVPLVARTDRNQAPAGATTHIHRLIRRRLGGDPYVTVKQEYNRKALAFIPELEARAAASADSFDVALRGALAGNMIDFGLFTDVDLRKEFEGAMNRPVCGSGTGGLKDALTSVSDVLYLLDNAGEIVFDGFFIETLQRRGHRVTAVVKGGPVINDATCQDADAVGLPGLCRVVDNGSDAVGTILDTTSLGFRRRFREAQMIISKGQANYETLVKEPAARDKTVAFLFQAKCDVVARVAGYPKGTQLVVHRAGRRPSVAGEKKCAK